MTTTTTTNGSTWSRMVHHTLGPVDLATNLAEFAEQNPDRFDSAMVTYTDNLARRLTVEVSHFNKYVQAVTNHAAKAVETLNGETAQTPEMVAEVITTRARELQSHGATITTLVETVMLLASSWSEAGLISDDEWQQLFPKNMTYSKAFDRSQAGDDTSADA